MWWWMHNGTVPWGWMVLGWLWMVVFWGGLIALVVWVVRTLAGRPTSTTPHRSPLDIARERLARGEITREEFEEIRKALES